MLQKWLHDNLHMANIKKISLDDCAFFIFVNVESDSKRSTGRSTGLCFI